MFFGNATMCPSDNGFGIRDHSMNPRQKFARRLRVFKNNPIMRQMGPSDRFSIGSPAIGANGFQKVLTFFRRGSVAQSFQKIFNMSSRCLIHYLHMGKTRFFFPVTVPIKRNGTQNGGLPFAPSPGFMAFGAEKRIIHFDQTSQTVSSIPVGHRFTNLMGHQPGGLIIRDLQDPLHLRYGHPHFVHGHMVDEPIPFAQRRSGLMENRPGRQAGFRTTDLAVQDISSLDKPGFPMSTSGTSEPSRPSKTPQVLRAGIFTGKFFLKIQQAALLISFGHWRTPTRSRVLYRYELSQ